MAGSDSSRTLTDMSENDAMVDAANKAVVTRAVADVIGGSLDAVDELYDLATVALAAQP